jgi:hypothetical protein
VSFEDGTLGVDANDGDSGLTPDSSCQMILPLAWWGGVPQLDFFDEAPACYPVMGLNTYPLLVHRLGGKAR